MHAQTAFRELRNQTNNFKDMVNKIDNPWLLLPAFITDGQTNDCKALVACCPETLNRPSFMKHFPSTLESCIKTGVTPQQMYDMILDVFPGPIPKLFFRMLCWKACKASARSDLDFTPFIDKFFKFAKFYDEESQAVWQDVLAFAKIDLDALQNQPSIPSDDIHKLQAAVALLEWRRFSVVTNEQHRINWIYKARPLMYIKSGSIFLNFIPFMQQNGKMSHNEWQKFMCTCCSDNHYTMALIIMLLEEYHPSLDYIFSNLRNNSNIKNDKQLIKECIQCSDMDTEKKDKFLDALAIYQC